MTVDRARAIERLRRIEEDAEGDAAGMDGRPLNGRTVGVQFGNLLASVKWLAATLRGHLEEEGDG